MVESFSDEEIQFTVEAWISQNEENYEDHFTIVCDNVKDSKIQLAIGDYAIQVVLTNGIATQINTKSQNALVQELVNDFNSSNNLRSSSLEETLTNILDKYVQLKSQQGGDDAEMDNGSDDDVDWGMGDEDPDQEDYLALTTKQVMEEEKQNQQKFGTSSLSCYDVMNLGSIKIFEQTKFYQECAEAQQYLAKNEHLVKGWLNIVLVKEILNLRLEIDLNYLDLTPSNILLFGWNNQDPLTMVFSGIECKLLNIDDAPASLDFKNVWNKSLLEFSCHNANKIDSYGCKSYLRALVEKFIESEFKSKNSKEEHKESSLTDNYQHKSSIGSKIKNFFSSGVDDEVLAQLVELGYEVKLAKNALKHSKNDIHKALDFIREQQLDGNFEGGKELLQLQMSQILPYTNNKIIQLLLYICNALETSTRNCFVCLDPLPGESIKLRPCNKDYCEYSFEESFGGSVYPELKFQTNEAHLDLSLAAKALFSGRGTTVFEPFPTFFLKHNEIRTKRGFLDAIKQAKEAGKDISQAKKVDEKNKDMENMMKIFLKLPKPDDLIKDCLDEEGLKENLKKLFADNHLDAHKAYQLLAYIIATNRTVIRLLKDDEKIDTNPKDFFQQYILTSSDPVKERIFMQNKKKLGSFYCWHGSSLENWFSIMRNGLRNLSNSHMMTAGAAYGQGIYASSNYYTSLGYTQRYTGGTKNWFQSSIKGQQYIIGVVEIINKPEYKKDPTCNICVIPNEDDIILRYLFVFGHSTSAVNYGANQSDLNTLKMNFEEHYTNYIKKLQQQQNTERKLRIESSYQKYLERKQKEEQYKANIVMKIKERETKEIEDKIDKSIDQMINQVQKKGSAMAQKRILADYKGMLTSSDFKDISTIEFVKDNMFQWKVAFDITKYEITKDLKTDFQQLAKCGKPERIEYEVIFSDDYPISPPFFRVVFPRFRYQTGHVTVGGSICMQSLTPSGWTSARSIESYFVEILSLLNEGGARLDVNNLNPYTIYEAKEAFTRVAKQHGWMK